MIAAQRALSLVNEGFSRVRHIRGQVKFYKYWARGKATVQGRGQPWTVHACSGSNEGLAEAQRRAQEVVQKAAAAMELGQPAGRYGYADRSLREEIVQEIAGVNGPSALITRNSYGALVLNTSRVMFVDVDDHQVKPSLGEAMRNLWNNLVGKAGPKPPHEERLFLRIDEVVRSHAGMGLRVYRTAGGFRLLVTYQTFDPTAAETHELLRAFGADRMYVRLCKMQECFRARLSAKFWRCGAERPPSRYPWVDAAQEAQYRQWEQDYHRRANQYATCELVQIIGQPAVHAEVAPILDIHDRLTIRAGAALA